MGRGVTLDALMSNASLGYVDAACASDDGCCASDDGTASPAARSLHYGRSQRTPRHSPPPGKFFPPTRLLSSGSNGGTLPGSARVDNRVTSRPPTWCDRQVSNGPKSPVSARARSKEGVTRRISTPSVSSPVAARGATSPSQTDVGTGYTKGDVSLYVRMRPSSDEDVCAHVEGRNGIRLGYAQPLRTDVAEVVYRCDHTFGPDAAQEDVYQQAVTPICESVIRGYNGAVIAYGQTGSGKTHTMIGNTRCQGVAPRAVTELFKTLEQRSNWTIEVSVLEIYNERVRDLLAPGPNPAHVDIHEICSNDGNLSFRCPDATMWKTLNPEDALAALSEGMRRRETARTDMNHTSSRSHLIFTLCTSQWNNDLGATLRGRLHLVDLAGSERLKRSMSTERTFRPPNLSPRTPRDQRREAGEINKSLSQLALVIQRLTGPAHSSLQYVPYRDSMLTRLLADSFGGNSKTCLIITISALTKDREETRCSLEFGKRAKLVKNKAEINLEVLHDPTPVMQALVQKEMRELQREKQALTRERDLLAAERQVMQAKLSATQDLMREHEEEMCALQQRHTEAHTRHRKVHIDMADQLAEQQGLRDALHSRLVEAATEIARLKQENLNTTRQHEQDMAHSRIEAAEQAKQLEAARVQAAAFRAETVALKERWLEDITRLESEKADFAAWAEEEKSTLRKRLAEAVAEAADQHDLRVRARLGSAANVEEASAAARQAEEDGTARAAQNSEILAGLEKQFQIEMAQITQSEQARKARLAELEADHPEAKQECRQASDNATCNEHTSQMDEVMVMTTHGSERLPTLGEAFQVGQVIQTDLTIDDLWGNTPSTPKSCLSWDQLESSVAEKSLGDNGIAALPPESGSSAEPFPGLRSNTL